jgi:outer membrane protein TolC
MSLLFCLWTVALAQDPAGFTLQAALDEAIEANPGLQAAREAVVQAEVQRDRAWSLIQPSINLGAQYRINDREIALDFADSLGGLTDTFSPIYTNLGFVLQQLFEEGLIDGEECDELATLNGYETCADLIDADFSDPGSSGGETEAIVVQPRDQVYLSAQFTWPLSPRIFPLHAAGRQGVQAAGGQIRRAEEQLLLGVVQAYTGAYGAQEAVSVLQEQVGLVEAHRNNANLLVAAGVATRDVAMRAELEVSKVHRQLAQTRVLASSLRRGLALALGRDAPDFGPLVKPEPMPVDDDLASLTRRALSTRGDLAAAEAAIAIHEALRTDAGLQLFPALAVQGSWTWSDTISGFDTQRWNAWLGLGVSIPLWDGGRAVQDVRAQSSQTRQARQQAEALRQQIDAEVADAHAQWTLARDLVPVLRQELELARETLTMVSSRFEAGTATQLEVLEARAGLQASELALVRGEVDVGARAAEVWAAAGRLAEAMR